MGFQTNLYSVIAKANGEAEENIVKKTLRAMRDKKNADAMKQANADLMRRALTPGVSHVDTTIQNMSVAYKNDDYIGERLMPVVPVPHKSDFFFTFDQRSSLGFPDDALGVRGSPNEITRARDRASFTTHGYGHKDFVDNSELQNADAPLDDLADATGGILDALTFRRELRIATILTTAANYGGNTTALGSSVRWDDADSKPISDIQSARAAMWTGGGPGKVVAFTSLAVWTAMQNHAQFQEVFKYTAGGILNPAQWANMFGIDELLIGAARKDTANEGQAASYTRIWGDVFGLVRVSTSPSRRNASFGYTFRFGQVDSTQVFDPMVGTKGGWWVKAAVDETHKVVAPLTGFLLTSVIG